MSLWLVEEEKGLGVPAVRALMDNGRMVSTTKKVAVKECCNGLGLFALERIGKGEIVQEYTGESIPAEKVDEWERKRQADGKVGDYMVDVEGGVIDGSEDSGPARFANHSCSSNCLFEEKNYEDGSALVIIRASVDIDVGDEITVDYMFKDMSWYIGCNCKSVHCRKWIVIVL